MTRMRPVPRTKVFFRVMTAIATRASAEFGGACSIPRGQVLQHSVSRQEEHRRQQRGRGAHPGGTEDEAEQGQDHGKPGRPTPPPAEAVEHHRKGEDRDAGIENVNIYSRHCKKREGLEEGESSERERSLVVERVFPEIALAQQPDREGDISSLEVVPGIQRKALPDVRITVRGEAEANVPRIY